MQPPLQRQWHEVGIHNALDPLRYRAALLTLCKSPSTTHFRVVELDRESDMAHVLAGMGQVSNQPSCAIPKLVTWQSGESEEYCGPVVQSWFQSVKQDFSAVELGSQRSSVLMTHLKLGFTITRFILAGKGF